jgi:hypothetical protein
VSLNSEPFCIRVQLTGYRSSTTTDDAEQANANVRALPWLNRVREVCRKVETEDIYDREVLEKLEARVDKQLSGHSIEALPGTVSYVGDNYGESVSITVKLLVGIGEDGSRDYIEFRRNLEPHSRVAAEALKLSRGDEIRWSASSYRQDSFVHERKNCGVSFYTQFTSLTSVQ